MPKWVRSDCEPYYRPRFFLGLNYVCFYYVFIPFDFPALATDHVTNDSKIMD